MGAAGSGKLEERLHSVLCCTVCLDLPKASVYQCTNGHLMCAGCFIHLLADARLKEEQATCPQQGPGSLEKGPCSSQQGPCSSQKHSLSMAGLEGSLQLTEGSLQLTAGSLQLMVV